MPYSSGASLVSVAIRRSECFLTDKNGPITNTGLNLELRNSGIEPAAVNLMAAPLRQCHEITSAGSIPEFLSSRFTPVWLRERPFPVRI